MAITRITRKTTTRRLRGGSIRVTTVRRSGVTVTTRCRVIRIK